MELTDNDKQRIEQAINTLYKTYFRLHSTTDLMVRAAEYATRWEREQQAIPKPCHFCGGNGFIMGYENSSRGCKYCNGSGQITENIECLSLPECYAESKKLEQLEAERSELADEIRKIISHLKNSHLLTPTPHPDAPINFLQSLLDRLNSLKTK